MDILKKVYDKISAAGSLEQYQVTITECLDELENKKMKHVADRVGNLSAVQVKRFSKTISMIIVSVCIKRRYIKNVMIP